MLVGYMRVSSDSDRQTTDLQRDALLAAGVDERHLFQDKASGARSDRSGLAAALDFVRAGDCLVVWKLDRLGRSLPHLLEIVTGLEAKQVGFRSLTEHMDTTTPKAPSCSACSAPWHSTNAPWPAKGSWRGWKLPVNAAGGAAAPGRSIPRSWRRFSRRLRTAPARPPYAATSASSGPRYIMPLSDKGGNWESTDGGFPLPPSRSFPIRI